MQVSVTLKARLGHSLRAFSLGPGLTEVVEFGGSPELMTGSDEIQPKMADTTLLQFSEFAHNYILTATDSIRASVDALCRDGAGLISRERVKRGRFTRQGTTS